MNKDHRLTVAHLQLSHDTYLFRFGLPSKRHILGLPVGKHFKIYGTMPSPKKKLEWNGREDNEQVLFLSLDIRLCLYLCFAGRSQLPGHRAVMMHFPGAYALHKYSNC